MPNEDKPARYRDLACELWRISLDQRQKMSFEARSRLATIAEEFEAMAQSIERKMEAD